MEKLKKAALPMLFITTRNQIIPNGLLLQFQKVWLPNQHNLILPHRLFLPHKTLWHSSCGNKLFFLAYHRIPEIFDSLFLMFYLHVFPIHLYRHSFYIILVLLKNL